MQQVFAKIRAEDPHVADLGLGVGICTGEAVVGNIGSEDFMDYTVIGNTPNTAKRLQESAKSGQILIDEPTYAAITSLVEAFPIEPLMLKGRSELVVAYSVMAVADCKV